MIAPPFIQSLGAPPEKHAYRVVGEMCRWLVGEQHRFDGLLSDAAESGRSKLGTPKAQVKFVDRVRAVNAKTLIKFELVRSGKRGKFLIRWIRWKVVRPYSLESIKPGDVVPERPWLVCDAATFTGRNAGGLRWYRLFVLTHHAMQRLAECGSVRTVDDLLDALKIIWAGLWDRMDKGVREFFGISLDEHLATKFEDKQTKPVLWKIPVAGGLAICVKKPERAFVVKTVLRPGMT